MNRIIFPVVLSTAILCTASQPLAQGRGGGPKPKGTSAPVTHGGGSVSRGGGSATHGGGAAAQGGKTQHGPKTTHGGGHAKTTTGAPKTPKSTTSATTRTNTTTTKTTTTTTTTTTGTTLTAVQQKLQRNTNLAEKLQSRLPGGTDVIAAAADFRNLGQYVAAVNVSNNLGLDFAKLKTAMVEDGKSLGQAIQLQRSSVDGTTEALRAQREADILISSTESSKPKATAKPKSTKDDRR